MIPNKKNQEVASEKHSYEFLRFLTDQTKSALFKSIQNHHAFIRDQDLSHLEAQSRHTQTFAMRQGTELQTKSKGSTFRHPIEGD